MTVMAKMIILKLLVPMLMLLLMNSSHDMGEE